MWPYDDDNDPSTPKPDRLDSGGTITDAFANPWVSIPYAIASGLMAGATPGTARLSQGLNAGLQMGIAGEKNAYQRQRERRLNDAVGKLREAKTPVTTDTGMPSTVFAPDTGEGSAPMSQARLDEALGGIPTHKVIEERPIYTPQQRAIMSALSESGNGPAVLAMMGQHAFKEPRQPPPLVPIRPGGALIDPETRKLVYQAPAEVKDPTWRPYQVDLGDKVESGLVSNTGEVKDVKTIPKGSAPARALSPEDREKTIAETGRARAQTQSAMAQAERARTAIRIARDPKAPTDKLTTELSVAVRDLKNARDAGDEEGAIEAAEVVGELRKALGRRATERNQGAVMDKLPDPKAHKGKIVRDTQTGIRMKSDGKSWVPIEGESSY